MEVSNNLSISPSQQQEVIQTLKTYNESLPTMEEKMEQLRRSLNVASLDNTFENYKVVPGTEKCLAAFRDLTSGLTDWKLLLCYGGVGNGKSHLLEATAIALYKQGIFCRVMTFDRMMATLKHTMDRDSTERLDNILSLYRTSPYLIVDDIGIAGSDSAWSFERLEEIIQYRYRENLFTILVTNLDIKHLPERVWDRFRDKSKARVVLNSAPSYRNKK